MIPRYLWILHLGKGFARAELFSAENDCMSLTYPTFWVFL